MVCDSDQVMVLDKPGHGLLHADRGSFSMGLWGR